MAPCLQLIDFSLFSLLKKLRVGHPIPTATMNVVQHVLQNSADVCVPSSSWLTLQRGFDSPLPQCIAVTDTAEESTCPRRLLFQNATEMRSSVLSGSLASWQRERDATSAALHHQDGDASVTVCLLGALSCASARDTVSLAPKVADETQRLLHAGATSVIWHDTNATATPRSIETCLKCAAACGVNLATQVCIGLRSDALAHAQIQKCVEFSCTSFAVSQVPDPAFDLISGEQLSNALAALCDDDETAALFLDQAARLSEVTRLAEFVLRN
jgi:hypothetical protein